MSIKWRLTLSFAIPLALAAIVAALFFYVAFQNWMIAREIDGNLRVYSALARNPLDSDNVDQSLVRSIWASLEDSNTSASPVYLQLIDSDGNVVLKSENLGEQTLPIENRLVENGLKGTGGIETVNSPNHSTLRIQVEPVAVNGQAHVLEVAQSLATIDPVLQSMIVALVLVIVVFLGLVIAFSAILIGRALSPVKEVTAIARSISSSSDLSRRVNYRGPHDEIGQLAKTFDRMIDQLDGLLRAQQSFVADASHELRGPLTVIRGNLDLLKRNMSEEDRQESLRALEAEANRMARVVNDLLVLAEVESRPLEQTEMVSLRDLILDAQDRALLLSNQHKITVDRQEDLWIKGDGHKLDQMVGNLVSNAVKYTPDGGTITLSLYRDGEWARIEVADTGMGIPPEHLPHIFDRFYRVDKARSRAGGGTGLGLAIVKGIAEQHGGRVTVTSQPGQGSTFTVWLRLPPEETS